MRIDGELYLHRITGEPMVRHPSGQVEALRSLLRYGLKNDQMVDGSVVFGRCVVTVEQVEG